MFAFDGITSLTELHLQEPWPKRNLGEAPEAATPVDAGAHQQLFYEEIQLGEPRSILSESQEMIQISITK